MSQDTLILIPSRVALSLETRRKMAVLLNGLVADALDLYSQAKQAHWNVRGSDFMALHELFDKVAEEADGHADSLAERAAQMGSPVEGSVRRIAKSSGLKEYPLLIAPGQEHVEAMADALGAFGEHLADGIDKADKADDPGTADLLTQINEAVDKLLWFVESHGMMNRGEAPAKNGKTAARA